MLEIFSYDFMQRAFIAVFAISIFAPLLGVFLVLRRQSLLSDTLSHVSLAGVAIGVVLSLDPTWTTIIIVAAAAVFMEYLRVLFKNYMELATAILMSSGLAIAMFLVSATTRGQGITLDSYLFGSIITVSSAQDIELVILAVFVFIAFIAFMRPLYVMTFDEDTARVDGLPVRLISLIFNLVTGIAIALMIPICGALLVSAIVILPAAIAMLVGKSFKTVLFLSVLIGFIGMTGGLIISYFYNAPASSAITLVFIVGFLLIAVVKRFARH